MPSEAPKLRSPISPGISANTMCSSSASPSRGNETLGPRRPRPAPRAQYELLIDESDYRDEDDLLENGQGENRERWELLANTADFYAVAADNAIVLLRSVDLRRGRPPHQSKQKDPPMGQCMPGQRRVDVCSPHMRHMRESPDKPFILMDLDGNWLRGASASTRSCSASTCPTRSSTTAKGPVGMVWPTLKLPCGADGGDEPSGPVQRARTVSVPRRPRIGAASPPPFTRNRASGSAAVPDGRPSVTRDRPCTVHSGAGPFRRSSQAQTPRFSRERPMPRMMRTGEARSKVDTRSVAP